MASAAKAGLLSQMGLWRKGFAVAARIKFSIDIAHIFVMAAQAATNARLAFPALRSDAVATSRSRYHREQSVCCSMRGRDEYFSPSTRAGKISDAWAAARAAVTTL
jgi:hypothetical protein